MKKLCIVTPCHWTKLFGGAEQQLSLLIDGLIASNSYELTYLAQHVDAGYKPSGYSIRRIESNPITMRLGNVIDARKVLSALNDIKPHVIYQRVGCAYTGIAAYYAKYNHCKMVWHISSDMNVLPFHLDKNRSSNPVKRYMEKKALEFGIRNSHVIIAQTRQQADLLNKYYGRWPERIIPNYQPIPDVSQKQNQTIRVVWISNIKPMKRPELFIRLANAFDNGRNVEFIMIGRSDGSTWCRQIESEAKGVANLEYVGEKSQAEVNDILEGSHVLVNTSSYEGFPNTFIQAWMRQVPVVSLEVNPDNVLEGNRIGFQSNTLTNLIEHVELLIKDHSLRRTMGAAARDYAIRSHSLANIEEIIREFDDAE